MPTAVSTNVSFLLAGWHAHDRRAAGGRTDRAARSDRRRCANIRRGLTVGGRDYGCAVSTNLYPDVLALWPRTTTFDSLFVIMWDQQGYCSSLSLHNNSAYL